MYYGLSCTFLLIFISIMYFLMSFFLLSCIIKKYSFVHYLNSAKSFAMMFSKASQIPTCNINVHDKILEQVHSFVYLGSQFTSDARCEKEIRRRIGIAKSAFTSMSKVLTSRDIHYDSLHQSAKMLCVVKTAIWMTLIIIIRK